MSNLTKLELGEDYNLPSMTHLRFGLRWTPVNPLRTGMGGWAERKYREKQGLTDPADWDAGAVLMTANDPKQYVGFGAEDTLKDEATDAERKSIIHSGDSIRGDKDGDDEDLSLSLLDIPKRYDGILLLGGAFKKGSQVSAVRGVKATIYDGTGGRYDAVGEFEPSLLHAKRMIVVARLDRSPEHNWVMKMVNESYDPAPGDFVSLLRGALQRS